MSENRKDYWVWEDGDVTIEFPEKKKAQEFNEIVNNKKELNKDDEEQ